MLLKDLGTFVSAFLWQEQQQDLQSARDTLQDAYEMAKAGRQAAQSMYPHIVIR